MLGVINRRRRQNPHDKRGGLRAGTLMIKKHWIWIAVIAISTGTSYADFGEHKSIYYAAVCGAEEAGGAGVELHNKAFLGVQTNAIAGEPSLVVNDCEAVI